MTIVSDIDGVLASFESAWEPLLAKLAGGSKLPKGWQDDPNFPSEWGWDRAAYGREIEAAAWDEVSKNPSFWKRLDPMPGAVEAALRLSALQIKHDVFFLTSRSGIGVQRQTCEWLYDIGVNYPNVIVVDGWEEKIPLLEHLGADFFVDDKLETMQAWYNHCYRAGIRTNQHYYALIDAPYNRNGRTVTGMKVAANITDALKQAGLWA